MYYCMYLKIAKIVVLATKLTKYLLLVCGANSYTSGFFFGSLCAVIFDTLVLQSFVKTNLGTTLTTIPETKTGNVCVLLIYSVLMASRNYFFISSIGINKIIGKL